VSSGVYFIAESSKIREQSRPAEILFAPLTGRMSDVLSELRGKMVGGIETKDISHLANRLSTTGNVTNPEALLADHEGYTTLTMAASGYAPMIILDYGRDVGGLPVFEVSSVSGRPQLRAIYSESQQSLLPHGDASASDGPGFDISVVGNGGAVWGHMRKGSPFYSGATWETLSPDATPAFGAATSLAHGWASGPTSALSKYVLGVRPIDDEKCSDLVVKIQIFQVLSSYVFT
jgi:hypothetical protein